MPMSLARHLATVLVLAACSHQLAVGRSKIPG